MEFILEIARLDRIRLLNKMVAHSKRVGHPSGEGGGNILSSGGSGGGGGGGGGWWFALESPPHSITKAPNLLFFPQLNTFLYFFLFLRFFFFLSLTIMNTKYNERKERLCSTANASLLTLFSLTLANVRVGADKVRDQLDTTFH
ncbi:hypothetical protein M0804_009787 [Polistes exclamans]|nr:hypothetical protein M0804_009787 [Polistes exclamans]